MDGGSLRQVSPGLLQNATEEEREGLAEAVCGGPGLTFPGVARAPRLQPSRGREQSWILGPQPRPGHRQEWLTRGPFPPGGTVHFSPDRAAFSVFPAS